MEYWRMQKQENNNYPTFSFKGLLIIWDLLACIFLPKKAQTPSCVKWWKASMVFCWTEKPNCKASVFNMEKLWTCSMMSLHHTSHTTSGQVHFLDLSFIFLTTTQRVKKKASFFLSDNMTRFLREHWESLKWNGAEPQFPSDSYSSPSEDVQANYFVTLDAQKPEYRRDSTW